MRMISKGWKSNKRKLGHKWKTLETFDMRINEKDENNDYREKSSATQYGAKEGEALKQVKKFKYKLTQPGTVNYKGLL